MVNQTPVDVNAESVRSAFIDLLRFIKGFEKPFGGKCRDGISHIHTELQQLIYPCYTLFFLYLIEQETYRDAALKFREDFESEFDHIYYNVPPDLNELRRIQTSVHAKLIFPFRILRRMIVDSNAKYGYWCYVTKNKIDSLELKTASQSAECKPADTWCKRYVVVLSTNAYTAIKRWMLPYGSQNILTHCLCNWIHFDVIKRTYEEINDKRYATDHVSSLSPSDLTGRQPSDIVLYAGGILGEPPCELRIAY